MKLRIEREFQEKIPPLTEAEFEQLKENIIEDGEVYEPIAVWNGVIIDGHNRWKIIQEHPEIPYKVREMDFADKWEAFEWMYKKQLGRRNLTIEQRSYLLGKMYEARKNVRGGDRRSEDFSKHQTDVLKKKNSTSSEIAKEIGAGKMTVERAGNFAKGVDAIRKISPEAADKILQGKSQVTRTEIQELSRKSDEEIAELAEAIKEDRPRRKPARPMSPQMKDFSKKLLDVVAEMENPDKEYGLDDAIRDLNSAEDVFLTQIDFIISERKEVIASDKRGREQVTAFIDSVINDLNILKGEI